MISLNSFGRLTAPKDGRDFRFLLRSAIPQLPKSKPRLRAYNEGPILDQGQKPHCVAYSGKGFMGAAPMMREEDYNTDTVYDLCQDNDEWPGKNYDGTSVRALMKVMQSKGYIASYVWGQSVSEVLTWTNGGFGTVIVGTNWYAEMSDVDHHGFMREPAPSFSTPIGGHAWRINWYDPRKNAFLMVNSWGHDFGILNPKTGVLSGTAYIRRELLERLLREDGEVAAPTQVKIKPTTVI